MDIRKLADDWASWAETLELNGDEDWYTAAEVSFYAGATAALHLLGTQAVEIRDEIIAKMEQERSKE